MSELPPLPAQQTININGIYPRTEYAIQIAEAGPGKIAIEVRGELILPPDGVTGKPSAQALDQRTAFIGALNALKFQSQLVIPGNPQENASKYAFIQMIDGLVALANVVIPVAAPEDKPKLFVAKSSSVIN